MQCANAPLVQRSERATYNRLMVVQVHPGAPNGAVLKLAEEICLENREGRKVARVRILPAPPHAGLAQ